MESENILSLIYTKVNKQNKYDLKEPYAIINFKEIGDRNIFRYYAEKITSNFIDYNTNMASHLPYSVKIKFKDSQLIENYVDLFLSKDISLKNIIKNMYPSKITGLIDEYTVYNINISNDFFLERIFDKLMKNNIDICEYNGLNTLGYSNKSCADYTSQVYDSAKLLRVNEKGYSYLCQKLGIFTKNLH